jgi:hypothetical protein
MSKFTKTRRDPGRTYTDQEKIQRARRMLERVHEFVESGIEAEPELVIAVKAVEPEITSEKLQKLITLFRDAVYDRQQRDQRRH